MNMALYKCCIFLFFIIIIRSEIENVVKKLKIGKLLDLKTNLQNKRIGMCYCCTP